MTTPVIPAGLTRDELLEVLDQDIALRARRLEAGGLANHSAAARGLFVMRAARDVIAQLPGEPEKQTALFGEGNR